MFFFAFIKLRTSLLIEIKLLGINFCSVDSDLDFILCCACNCKEVFLGTFIILKIFLQLFIFLIEIDV